MSELLTRLNPKTARFDIGVGGIHEITDQDIAAALGMVANKLGARILLRMHAPEMVDWHKLDMEVFDLVRSEWRRREEDRVTAELRLLLAGARRSMRGMIPSRDGGNWPAFKTGRYMALARAVVQEVIHGDSCQVCRGRQRVTLQVTGEVIVCGHCSGTGIEPEAARQRSRRMGMDHKSFLETWAAPYRWTHSEVLAAAIEASSQFRAALGRRAA